MQSGKAGIIEGERERKESAAGYNTMGTSTAARSRETHQEVVSIL